MAFWNRKSPVGLYPNGVFNALKYSLFLIIVSIKEMSVSMCSDLDVFLLVNVNMKTMRTRLWNLTDNVAIANHLVFDV